MEQQAAFLQASLPLNRSALEVGAQPAGWQTGLISAYKVEPARLVLPETSAGETDEAVQPELRTRAHDGAVRPAHDGAERPAGPGAIPAAAGQFAPLAQEALVTIPELPPGKVVTITFQAVIADLVPPGLTQVANQGQVSGANFSQLLTDDPDTPEPGDPTITLLDLAAELSITKQVSPTEVRPGQALTYTLAYSNAGPNLVRSLVISDLLPGGLISPTFTSTLPVTDTGAGFIWDAGDLAPGQSGLITLTATVDPATPLGTQIDNTAEISATTSFTETNLENNSATATVVVAESALTLTKTLETSGEGVDAGDTIRYRLRVEHTAGSNAGAFNLNLTDTLPAAVQDWGLASAVISNGITDTDVISSFSLAGNGLETTGSLDLLSAAGGLDPETLTLVVEGVVGDAITPASVISNTARLTWESSSGPQPDFSVEATAPAITVPGVFTVTKSVLVSSAQVSLGQLLTYQLETTVIEGTTTNLQYVDTLPIGLNYVPGSAVISNTNGMTATGFNASLAGQVLSITIDSLVNPGNTDDPAGIDTDSFFITYQARVAASPGNGELTNDVDATADDLPADIDNQTTVTVISPLLTITKAVDDATPAPGQMLTYQIAVSHLVTSTATAHDLVISDTLPSGLTYVPGSASLPPGQVDDSGSPVISFTIPSLAMGSSTSFTYQATVGTPPAANPGDTLTNEALLTWTSLPGPEPGEAVSTATATETVTVTGLNLGITKSAQPAAAIPGQVVTYTLIFSNAGNEVATGVVISDPIPAQLTDVSFSSSGATVVDTGAVPPFVWEVGDLPGGAGGTITVTGRIDPLLVVSDTTIINTAEITGAGDIAPANNSAQASIDVTVPGLSFSSDTYEVAEAAGAAVISVTLDIANPSAAVSVNYATADGTATAGSDYTAVSGTLTIPAGATQATFTVPILDDADLEGAETVQLSLSSPAGASLVEPDTATLTILDDEQAPVPPVFLPMILKEEASAPPPPPTDEPSTRADLVIDSLTLSGSDVTLVIRNQGQRPVEEPFWIDVYINPRSMPGLNIPWYDIADHGVVWGITGDALNQLGPGGTLTLTVGDAHYYPQYSRPTVPPAGSSVYAFADPINFSTTYGAVPESDESNNLFGPVSSPPVGTEAGPAPAQLEPRPVEGLPER